jgi:hypothetical protein
LLAWQHRVSYFYIMQGKTLAGKEKFADESTPVMTSTASSIASSRRKELPSAPRERLKCSSAWRWEALSFLASLACMGAIIIILARYDDKPLPQMGWLNLNGIVSTLAGISKAALILPISEAISQLKWH